MSAKSKIFLEIFVAWIVVVGAARFSSEAAFFPLLQKNSSLVTAVLLLYVPVIIYLKRKERVGFFDRTPREFFHSLKVTVVISLIIFPLSFAVNHVYQGMLGHAYHPSPFPHLWDFLLAQILLVSFPEEFFFRGYLQDRLRTAFGAERRLLGVTTGAGFFLCALIFALSHSLITFQWWHGLIFFPALVFGWLRERTGSITAPILFHFLCNLFSRWVLLNYS